MAVPAGAAGGPRGAAGRLGGGSGGVRVQREVRAAALAQDASAQLGPAFLRELIAPQTVKYEITRLRR